MWSVLKRVWERYRGRKRRRGVVIDFVFLVAFLVVLVPGWRRGIVTYVVRAVLTQPREYDKIVFLGAGDEIRARGESGADTVLSFQGDRALLVSFGSVWSSQTRAGLSSMARSADKYAGRVGFYFLTEDREEDVREYFGSRGYGGIRVLYVDVASMGSEGFVGQLAMSVPSSALVRGDGRVIVKKLGATCWYGSRADRCFELAMGEVDE